MSSFWKKFKSGNTLQKSVARDVSLLHLSSKPAFKVKSTDEEAFLNATEITSWRSAPINLPRKSQLSKNLRSLLVDSPALPYFLEFLHLFEADRYAQFWIDCEKLRHLDKAGLENCINDVSTFVTKEHCISTDLEVISKKKEYKRDTCNNQNNIIKVDHTLPSFLPDLVSNIPENVPVTPLPSPDEISGLSHTSDVKNEKTDEILDGNSQGSNKIQNIYANLTSDDSLKTDSSKSVSHKLNIVKSDISRQRLKELSHYIYNKYIHSDGDSTINFSDSVLKLISAKATSNDCILQCGVFYSIQGEIYNFLEKEYFFKFLDSEFYLKFQIDVFTSESFTIEDVLSCDSSLPYLMEFMEQEGAQVLVEFWLSVFNFKEQLETSQRTSAFDSSQAQVDAIILYDKYFSLQATHSLGFSDAVRFLVESNISQENGLSSYCFDTPLKIVLHILQRDYFGPYLLSPYHNKYVNELIKSLKKLSGSGSTSSSEQSGQNTSAISYSNTLLAMESSKGGILVPGSKSNLLKGLDENSLSMRIDSVHITDPDSLWRRKNFLKLSCGYVDEFGRFESDIRPEPDTKIGSTFSQRLRKFSKIEEQKMREELAYKAAEIIIKDVTNVTLSDSKHHPVNFSSFSSPADAASFHMTRSRTEMFSTPSLETRHTSHMYKSPTEMSLKSQTDEIGSYQKSRTATPGETFVTSDITASNMQRASAHKSLPDS